MKKFSSLKDYILTKRKGAKATIPTTNWLVEDFVEDLVEYFERSPDLSDYDLSDIADDVDLIYDKEEDKIFIILPLYAEDYKRNITYYIEVSGTLTPDEEFGDFEVIEEEVIEGNEEED